MLAGALSPALSQPVIAGAPTSVQPAAVTPAESGRLTGHGGPVMDLAVGDVPGIGPVALSASFDNSVGLWTLGNVAAENAGVGPLVPGTPRWLVGHKAAVKSVTPLGRGRAVSAGDDFALIIWDLTAGTPLHRLEGHKGAVADVAVSPSATLVASAGWDGAIGLWRPDGTRAGWLEGHGGAVNALVFADDDTLLSASADGTLRVWSVAAAAETRVLARHGFAINQIAVDPAAGWAAYGAVDGGTRIVSLGDGAVIADLTAGRRPILALALSPDRAHLAIGDGEGHVMTVSTADWTTEADMKVAERGPIWALAFAGNETLIAGGIDDSATIIPRTGLAAPAIGTAERTFHRDPAMMDNGERQFQRKCSVCHTLTGDGGRKAGPTFAGLFGRRAGTVPGYPYSDMLAGSDIVWTGETLSALFDLGPEHYVPGSNMPMQRIVSDGDRTDLIEFLRTHTE